MPMQLFSILLRNIALFTMKIFTNLWRIFGLFISSGLYFQGPKSHR